VAGADDEEVGGGGDGEGDRKPMRSHSNPNVQLTENPQKRRGKR
jgi:hypothetical protein